MRYVPYIKDILGVYQGDILERHFSVNEDYDLNDTDDFEMLVRKTYGNKSILLTFKKDDDTIVVDADTRRISIFQAEETMQIEGGMHVYTLKNKTTGQTIRQGIFEVIETAIRSNA